MSEVVGSSLLLAITVAVFAALFLLVQGMPKPSPGVAADLQGSLERTGPNSANVVINHVGGEDLRETQTVIAITVNNTTLKYNVSDGLGGQLVFAVGEQWRVSLPLTVSPNTRVVVTVVSRIDNSVLYTSELQAGYTGGSPGYPPIIVVRYAISKDGDAAVTDSAADTYRIHVVAIDPDGNLDSYGGVWADITVTPVGPQLQTTALGVGRFNLTRTHGSDFETSDLVMGIAVPPGNYTVVVHAQDLTGGSDTASLPLTVVGVSGSQGPTISVSGNSIAPISVNTSANDVGVLRLNISSSGGDTSLAQIIVVKTGSLPDGQVTLSAWVDANNDGVFSTVDDMELTPETAFVSGAANIFGAPIVTVPGGTTEVLFVVASLTSAADGTNVTFSLTDTTSVRGTGVPGGLPGNTTGSFPITTSDVVVGSKLSIEPRSGAPDRLLVGTKNVRLLEFTVRAAGEPFGVKQINITLGGTVPRSSASCYVKINGQMISAARNFDSSRVARFSVNYLILDTAGWMPMEVYLNLSGSSGQTVAIQVAADYETFAQGQVSGKGRNGVSSAPFPLDSGTVTLTNGGNLSIDDWNDTSLATSVRAGMNNIYLHTFKVRAHGENIDFNKFEMVQTGNLTDAQFLAITLRVHGGVWLSGSFFAGKVSWDAGVAGKLFGITVNVTNAGEAVFDVYANITAGVQAKEFSLYVNDNTKARGYGKTSLTTLYANAENAPFPISLGVRRIQGDVLIWGANLSPSLILAPVNLVPTMKLTVRPVGENVTFDEIFLRSLQGAPPAGALFVHLYRDTNNDTTTAVQGDDVEVTPGDAGPIGSDSFKAFAPAVQLPAGNDTNFFFAVDFATSGAGFSMETRVNTSNVTMRGLYSLSSIPPNQQNGITNPPSLIYQTPPAPIYDRGTLTVVGTNLNGADHVNNFIQTKMLRVTLTAAVENVAVNSVKVHMLGNATGSAVNVTLWWDKNKDDNITGADVQLGSLTTFGAGDVTFSGSPLLTVNATQTEDLIVRITVNTAGQENHTVGVELTTSSFIGAAGVTSGLGITPAGTFPMGSPVVPIYA